MATLDRVYVAQHLFEQRRYEACVEACTSILAENALDQAAWFLKTRALTEQGYIDDLDLEEDGVAEILLDDNALAGSGARPGTSLQRPLTTTTQNGGLRPMTGIQRPTTGFARPGASTRMGTASDSVRKTLQSGRPTTSRPLTVAGRQVRLGTQSMMLAGENGAFIDVAQIDVQKVSKRPALAKALCDYLLYIEHNPKKALELAMECARSSGQTDWWWLARSGKAYYQLGMLREAQAQLQASLKMQEMVATFLELGKVYLRVDQPNSALSVYAQALEGNPGEPLLHIGMARVHQAINDYTSADAIFRKVLHLDASNIEAIASLAGQYFYNDQPEIALRFYRRLLQMGVGNTEIWNNVGLCCFYSAQYDMTLTCFERALALADDSNMADVWYNIGHIAVGIGDLTLAMQALKVCISIDGNHAEAFNNLGVLELRKGGHQQACAYFEMASELADHHFEPMFNAALVAEAVGDLQKSWNMVTRALNAFPDHADSIELRDRLVAEFITV
ncbi:unnamed protein product (mitochondrion) [Plasmodiophora brassicae]|uniref:Uncharacterized protein n=1 Tax=Plasmodiophora brassicae TaxID=37360 RepID=A0A0G4IR91_PLABS|nr:hypothetical protein PBRA_005899 [Plasmodiophora brassicae]SPQ98333.1 unnamed protein product [Plasmodiophora brassicae]